MRPVFSLRTYVPLALLICFGLLSLFSYYSQVPEAENQVVSEASHNLNRLLQVLQGSLASYAQHGNYDHLLEHMDALLAALASEQSIKQALVIDEAGRIAAAGNKTRLGQSADSILSSLRISRRSPVLTADAGVTFDHAGIVTVVQPVSLPSVAEGNRHGTLLLQQDISADLQLAMRDVRDETVRYFADLTVLALLLWLLFNRLITRRMDGLVATLQQISAGNLAARSGFKPIDELGVIGRYLDSLADSLALQHSAARESEVHLRRSQEFAQIGSWKWELSTNELTWSENINPLFGLSCGDSQLSYAEFANVVHPQDRAVLEQAISDCLQLRREYDIRHRIVWPNGEVRWMHEKGNVERDAEGRPLRMLGTVRDVTQEMQAQLELQRALNELDYRRRAVDEHAIVAETDLDGIITYANDRFCQVSQFSREELIGQNHDIVNSGYHSQAFFQEMWQTIEAGNIWHGEICNRRRDGTLYWEESTIVPRLNKQQQPESYIAIRTDITERILAKERLQEEHRLLEAIYNIQSQFLLDKDPGGSFEILLQTLLEVTDSEMGVIGEVLHAADGAPYLHVFAFTNNTWDTPSRQRYEAQWADGFAFSCPETVFGKVMQSGRPLIKNHPLIDDMPDEHPSIENYVVLPLFNGDQMTGIVSIANRPGGYNDELLAHFQPLFTTCARVLDAYRAAGARGLVEMQLAKEKEFLNTILDNLHEGVVACNAEGELTLFNRATREFHGLPMTSMPAKHWAQYYDMYHPDGITLMQEADIPLVRALAGEKVEDAEMIIAPKAGGKTRRLLASGQAFFDSRGNKLGAVISMNDITDSRQLEQQLRQAQKMESVGQLTGGIAHDFNNMLASIMGYTDLARSIVDDREDDGELAGFLEQVFIASERARDLIAQLLQFSRTDAPISMMLDVVGILKEAVKLMRSSLPSSISLHLELEDDLPQIVIDTVSLHQLVMNLCINARDAIGSKGNIHIRVSHVRNVVDTCASCQTTLRGDYLLVQVVDDGSGMSPDVAQKIFEPFFTTKAVGKGSGMGLSVVHGIMHRFHGHLQLQTRPGAGTNFQLYFPVVQLQATAQQAESVGNTGLGPRGAGQRILIVDDEQSVALFESELLKHYGYATTVMTSSSEALALFSGAPASFDLVLTDQTMPELSGAEMAEEMLALRPDLPIILCTGYSDTVNGDNYQQFGISAYLTKPIDTRRLLQHLKDLLNHAACSIPGNKG